MEGGGQGQVLQLVRTAQKKYRQGDLEISGLLTELIMSHLYVPPAFSTSLPKLLVL